MGPTDRDLFGDADILKDREPGKDAAALEGPANAQADDLMGGQMGNLFPSIKDLPGACGDPAGDDIEEGRLAGSIGTDDRVQGIRRKA